MAAESESSFNPVSELKTNSDEQWHRYSGTKWERCSETKLAGRSSFNQYNKLNKLHFVDADSLINQIEEKLSAS